MWRGLSLNALAYAERALSTSQWAHVCCINVGLTSNFDVDDVLKRCWICKLDRRRNVDVVSTSPYQCILVIRQCTCIQRKDNVGSTSKNFRRRLYVVFTLNARVLINPIRRQSSCAPPLLRFWGSDVAKNFNWGGSTPFFSLPFFFLLFPFFLPVLFFPPFPWTYDPLLSRYGIWGSAVSSYTRVWADLQPVKFGAF